MRYWIFGLAVGLLLPGVAQGAFSLQQSGFNGVGTAVVQRDGGGSGTEFVLSGNAAGWSAGGVVSGGGFEVLSNAGFRLTNLLTQVQEFDVNGDGAMDQISFTYEAPVQSATAPSVYRMDGVAGSKIVSTSNGGRTVTVAVAGLAGTERKVSRYTAADGVSTDAAGNPVFHWPRPANRQPAQVEQDRANPVIQLTSPAAETAITGTVAFGFTSSESLKATTDLIATRVRGLPDGASPHTANPSQTGNNLVSVNTNSLGLVQGAGYRFSFTLRDKADEGDPGTAVPNEGGDEVYDLIYTGNGNGFVYVAAQGSDTTGNGTASNPYRTLEKGVEEAAGGAVYALPGLYTIGSGPLEMATGVEVRGSGADLTQILGTGNGCAVEFDQTSGAALIGFTVVNGRPGSGNYLKDSAVCVYGGDSNLIRNNIFRQSHTGVRLDEAGGTVVEYNTIVRNANHGISLRHPATSRRTAVRVENNVVAENSGTCVYYEIPSGSANTAGNLVQGNVLFPAGCGSDTSRGSLSASNDESDPDLDGDYVPGDGGDIGWNGGEENTVLDPEAPAPTVRAMNPVGLMLGILVAMAVAIFMLQRRKPPGGSGGPPKADQG